VLSTFEEFLLYVTIPLVALFAHKEYTYEFSTPKYAILCVATLILAVYLLIRLFKSKQLRFFATPVHFAWLTFAFVAIASTINTYRDNPYFFRQSIDIALYLLLNVVLSFYFSSRLNDKSKIIKLLFVFLLTGLFIAINAILNFYVGYDLFLGNVGAPFERGSIKANIGNVIFVSNYLNMLLPIALYFLLSLDVGALSTKKFGSALILKIVALISAILYFDVIIFSQTRSEYLALVVEAILIPLIYFFFIRKKEDTHVKQLEKKDLKFLKKLKSLRRITVAVFAIMVIIIIVIYNTPTVFNNYGSFKMTDRFSAMSSVSSIDERFLSWFSTIYIWKNHKILGQGIGTYQVYGLYGISDLVNDKPEYNYGWNNFKRAHNDYFQVLGETGILGLAIIILMLVLLTIYVFKNMKKIEMKDDSILFGMLVLSGIVFAFQSVFSFPGHLLPNALFATFAISVGLGKYFNKVNGKEYVISGTKALIVGVALVAVIGTSTYLRWNHFVSEVYFRKGNEAFSYLNAVRDSQTQIEQYLSQLDSIENELKDFSGQFEYLKPETWHKIKQGEAQRLGIMYNQSQSEGERVQTIANIRAQIANNKASLLSQRQMIPGEIEKYYTQAKDCFVKSVQINKTYGKSFFYLAALATDQLRIAQLSTALRTSPEKVFEQTYDEYQTLIFEPFRYRYFEGLSEYVKNNPEILDQIDLATMQALADSIGLYETSLKSFTERNTFRALAMRYHGLYQYANIILYNYTDESVQKAMIAYPSRFFNGYANWVRKTVNIMPGGWNRFPDWKNVDIELATGGAQDIYRYFANTTVQIMDPVNYEARDLLTDLARTEIRACVYMEKKGVWGVPDGVLDHLHALAREYRSRIEYQESLYTLEQIVEWYKEPYTVISQKVASPEEWKTNYGMLVEDWKSALDNILEKDEKGYLSNSLTPMFVDKLNRIYDAFLQSDFRTIETSFIEEMNKYPPSYWSQINKVSIWKSMSYNAMSDFQTQLSALSFSDTARQELTSLLQSVISNNLMLVYERYLRFKSHYDSAKQELLQMAQELTQFYSDLDEEHILADWSEVSFNSPIMTSKEEVMNHLNEVLEKYSEQ